MLEQVRVSLFRSVADRRPAKVSLPRLMSLITDTGNDVWLYTRLSREERAEGHEQKARKYKAMTGAVTPAGLFEGGHQASHLTGLSGLCMADFDHISSEAMADAINKVKADKHTVMEYVTNSGCGLRVFYRWTAVDEDGVVVPTDVFGWQPDSEQHDDFLRRVHPYHALAYRLGNAYYARLLGMASDEQTKDVNRLSFLAHDEHAYLNMKAEAFVLSARDVREQTERTDRGRKASAGSYSCRRGSGPSAQGAAHVTNVFDLVETWVEKKVAYQPGTYNRYVSSCGYLLCEFGVPEGIAEEWAVARFSDYRASEVASVIRSCYRGGRFGTKTFYNYK